jgi:N-acetylglucosamine kinase-like BadF-type ATPase
VPDSGARPPGARPPGATGPQTRETPRRVTPGTDVTARVAALLDGVGPVLGIDAGGTSTRAALVSGGAVRERYSCGPFNFLLSGDGVPRMAEMIKAAAPAAAGIGVPGIARQPGAATAFGAAVSEASGVPTRAASDGTVAWLGAFLGAPGIVVMAGTGAVAVGGRAGSLAIVGGHGHLVGDEGSRYWIGRAALRAALAADEGTGPPTALAAAVAATAGGSLYDLMTRVQRAPGDRGPLVSLVPAVRRCAEAADPDPVALAIVTGAAAALADLAGGLRRRFGELPVAAAGGVFGIRPLWQAFQRLTGAGRPLAPPEVGAALLAAGLDGTPAGWDS